MTLSAYWIDTDVSEKPVALVASYSQPDGQIHNLPPYLFKIRFNFFVSTAPMSQNSLLPSGYSNNVFNILLFLFSTVSNTASYFRILSVN